MILAERVIWVHEALRISSNWRLDVPESVFRDGIEDLLVGRFLKAACISILEVLNEVVLLTLLEDGEFLVEDCFKLLNLERRLLFHLS